MVKLRRIKYRRYVMKSGQEMYDFAAELFPIGRSLTCKGVRQSLEMIHQYGCFFIGKRICENEPE